MRRPLALSQSFLSLSLSGLGGFVDGVGFLMLYRLFISHMSGNSTMLGLFLAESNWAEVLHRVFPIALFVLGAFAATLTGTLLAERGKEGGVRLLLTVEAILLTAFGVLAAPLMQGVRIVTDSAPLYYLLVSLPAFAMGLQNAVIRQSGGSVVRTTFVSGILTSVGEGLAGLVHWAWREGQRRQYAPWRRVPLIWQGPEASKAAQAAGVWFCYVTGAFSGATLIATIGVEVVALPVIALLSLAAFSRPAKPSPAA